MSIQVLPNRFLVRINKQEQHNFKYKYSKSSPIYIPLGNIFNSKNMECGEIVQIGKNVETLFEGCEVGHTLIFHHSIEDIGKEGKGYFVDEDETYNYYVCPFLFARGYYDGSKITPTNEYIFLKNISALPSKGERDDISGRDIQVSKGGIFTFSEWKDSPQDIAEKVEKIKQRVQSLTKSTRTPQIQTELENLDKESQRLNKEAQKKAYLPYRLAASNKIVDRNFGFKLKEDDLLYCFNKECLYISNFQDKEYSYIICRNEGIGLLQNKNKKELSACA